MYDTIIKDKEGKKDLVWLPAELAKKVQSLTDARGIENEIMKYVSDFKLSLRTDIEAIDEEIIRYKASMIRAKQLFKEACDEQMTEFEDLWDKHEDDLARVKRKAEQIKEAIAPIKQELQTIKTEMAGINTWDIKDLLVTLEKISNVLTYDTKTSGLVKFLFENYKKA